MSATVDEAKVEAATRKARVIWWRPPTERPEPGQRIVALYNDGSGARLFFVHDGGLIDSDGDDAGEELPDSVYWWSPIPGRLWCETLDEDPLRFDVEPGQGCLSSNEQDRPTSASWQPIESAPRCTGGGDGTNGRKPVLVVRAPFTGHHAPMAIARLTAKGWITGTRRTALWFKPTHWQPLPLPPLPEGGEA